MRVEFDPEQVVSLTVLTSAGAPTTTDIRIVSISGRRMSVITGEFTSPVGTPVRIEWPQYLILAEVLRPQDLTLSIELYIRHVLNKKDIEPIRRKWVNL